MLETIEDIQSCLHLLKDLQNALVTTIEYFFILSEEIEKAVVKNKFPDGNQFACSQSRHVFRELINHERPYAKEGRSKIVLVDFFGNSRIPGT